MSFANLNVALAYLRDALRAQVDPKSIDDVNIPPPAGRGDEVSFYRLTAWSYIVLYEAGRISISFLLRLPFVSSEEERRIHQSTRGLVRTLRTALVHNLGFADRDLEIRKETSNWFVETCHAHYPISADQWSRCFDALCTLMCRLLAHCMDGLNAIAGSPEDRDSLFRDLRRRLLRNWDADQFDAIVEDSATALGERIDARRFRDRRLSVWREFLETLPEDADLDREVTRRIDREVFDHFQSALPFTTREMMAELELQPGQIVKQAMAIAREVFDGGVRDRHELLGHLRRRLMPDGKN